ncbi:outer membrane lipoprotein LolB [Moraxella haemolytica]|uniref:outer membrane lipoprotein LolB n=1 Tax=Moraxella haemolytica TaxID=2904119 RepID=UPI0025434E00|nr:outer membrane lipoprotein LolB [Moraxella sp. ZY171148]WII95028.1 outer membrane lipoprotein LolB [Moraxella sp. ZY171148]
MLLTKTTLKTAQMVMASCLLTVMAGCQTLPKNTPTTTATINAPIQFNITGKIGMITISADNSQSGTAFYAWVQEGERFAIDLTGALGIGATTISFDGKTATLHNQRIRSVHADSPEELLTQVTGWQAPISQLPYWIIGKTAPSDSDHQYDDKGRLAQAVNSDWIATFEYKGNLPNRLRITHTDGHRIIMSIIHGN